MGIKTYAEVSDLIELVPRLRAGRLDIDPAILLNLLEFRAVEISTTAEERGFDLDTQEPLPELILQLLNLDMPVAELIFTRFPEVHPDLVESAMTHKKMAEMFWMWFKTDEFCEAWRSTPLEQVRFATDEESISYVHQFQRFKLDDRSVPSINVVRRLNDRYSAAVAAAGAKKGYPITGLTDIQRVVYSRIVSQFVSAWVLRIRSEFENPALDSNANMMLMIASESMEKLVSFKFDNLFD